MLLARRIVPDLNPKDLSSAGIGLPYRGGMVEIRTFGPYARGLGR